MDWIQPRERRNMATVSAGSQLFAWQGWHERRCEGRSVQRAVWWGKWTLRQIQKKMGIISLEDYSKFLATKKAPLGMREGGYTFPVKKRSFPGFYWIPSYFGMERVKISTISHHGYRLHWWIKLSPIKYLVCYFICHCLYLWLPSAFIHTFRLVCRCLYFLVLF